MAWGCAACALRAAADRGGRAASTAELLACYCVRAGAVPAAAGAEGPASVPRRPARPPARRATHARSACTAPVFACREEDSPEEAAQKDRLIAIYNRRLDERERRRAFVLDRGLLNVKRQQVPGGRLGLPGAFVLRGRRGTGV